MKIFNQYVLFATSLGLLSLFNGCNYEEINTNPFEMTDEMGKWDGVAVGGSVTAMQRAVVPVGTQADDTNILNEYQTAYNVSADTWSGFFGQNNNWNGGNNHTTFYMYDNWIASTYRNSYTNLLSSWKSLKQESEKTGTPEVFALAQILKISAWHKTLETFGPIPYVHAGDATLVIPFDSEKEVYTAMFNDLTQAIEELSPLAEAGSKIVADYDAVYAGDVKKWVKYANSLMLRLAMHISYADEAMAKKYASQALNQQFGVMTAKDDEAQMSSGAGMVFRNNIEWLASQYNETRMGSSMYSYLLGYEDPRLSAYFQPGSATIQGDSKDYSQYFTEAFDGQKYQAVPPGHTYGQNTTFQSFSQPNITSATPTYWMRASEIYFLRAEAALRWGGEYGDAETLYRQGVQMSFEENGVTSSVNSYLSSGNKPMAYILNAGSYSYSSAAPTTATTEFTGTTEQKLEKIITQKWIALYPNGQEAWTEWRRTGYPKLNPVKENRGAGQGVTKESGIRRMVYPVSFSQSEKDRENYQKAVEYLGGDDKPTTRLWWDCKN